MKRLILALVAAGVVGCGAFLVITRPQRTDAAELADMTGDAVHGQAVFWAGGCTSCHAAPGSEGDAKLVLSGGLRLNTDFGTFVVPNISPDLVHGIGAWKLADLDTAMRHGTSPQGKHYYPAFPYTSYANTTHQDVADLWAFLQTLPPSDHANAPHELGFPFNQRLLLGGWKFINPRAGWVVTGDLTEAEMRGRYLVEGLGHCSECHTPRNILGVRQMSRWLAGGPNPEGKGKIPNITPAHLEWSAEEVANYLKSGFTPDYDTVGGSMADVVSNLAHLSDGDRMAIAAYLQKVSPVQ